MPSQSKRTALAALVIALATAVGVAWYLTRPPEETPAGGGAKDAAIPVEAVTLAPERLERTIPTVGSLRSNESVVVSTEIAGRIEAIPVEEGQSIAKGTLIVSLDQDVYRAELAQIEARLALSQTNHKRATELLQRGAGTERARDEAVAALRADEASVTLARARLAKTRIVAPFEGVLGLRRMSAGQYVDAGDPIINLESIDPLKADFRLPEIDFSKVAVGRSVALTIDAFAGEVFHGEVYAIDPLIDVEGRAIVVRARVPNADRRLRPGLFARVDLVYEVRENAILVPEQALVPRGERNFVFRVVEGKAMLTEVKTGERKGARVEIVEGLTPGDQVVTAGQMKLEDGKAVTVLPPGGG